MCSLSISGNYWFVTEDNYRYFVGICFFSVVRRCCRAFCWEGHWWDKGFWYNKLIVSTGHADSAVQWDNYD